MCRTWRSVSRRRIAGLPSTAGCRNEAKRLKELEAQNARLKKLVANQALDTVVGIHRSTMRLRRRSRVSRAGQSSLHLDICFCHHTHCADGCL